MSSSSKSKNLILGAIDNYDFRRLYPFVRSLRAVEHEAHVVFFAKAVSADTEEKLKEFSIEVVRVADQFPFFKAVDESALSALLPQLTTVNLKGLEANCWRYIAYRCLLALRPDSYQQILLTDTRDVIFQASPFSFDIGNSLHVFLEDRSTTIGSNQTNSTWIQTMFGDKTLEMMTDHPVSCSGTTFGSREAVTSYLDKMIEHIIRIDETIDCFYRGGLDQGIHNYLIATNALTYTKVHDNEAGPVLTQLLRRQPLVFTGQGFLLNESKEVPLVIHQHDARPEIWNRAQQRIEPGPYMKRRMEEAVKKFLTVSGLKGPVRTIVRKFFPPRTN